ncbi:MAG: hypothetical protein Phog2KO_13900 [Phototrophicaceae bacterium]
MEMKQEYVDLLNHFYFNEFLPELPPELQTIATDPYVLFHRDDIDGGEFNQITQYVRLEYWLTPWFLADIFPATDEEYRLLNEGYLLIFLAYLVLDHLVDGQTPDNPLIPLLIHQFFLGAFRQFSKIFADDPHFWDAYHRHIKAHNDALSIEYASVATYTPPFSYERMEIVAKGKVLPFNIGIEALGRVSGREDLIPIISRVYELHMFGDQFYDDADDYLDDFKIGRATMAMVYLSEAENTPLADLMTLDADVIREKVIINRIREKMIAQSTRLLKETIALLPENFYGTRLHEILVDRLEMDKTILRSFRGVYVMTRLSNSLR